MTLPLKYQSNICRTLEMLLINCTVNLILTQTVNSVISSNTNANQATTFTKTDTKLYAPVVPLSTNDNTTLLQQLKSGSRGTISKNKYQSKVTIQRQNQYLDYLVDPSFQGLYRLLFYHLKIMWFENYVLFQQKK